MTASGHRRLACRRSPGGRRAPVAIFPVLALALVLGSCAEQPKEPRRPVSTGRYLGDDNAIQPQPLPPTDITPQAAQKAAAPEENEPQIDRRLGTDTFVNPNPEGRRLPPPVELTNGDELTVNMYDVPVRQAAKAVLGDTLGLDYAVAEGVDGRVTVQTSNPVSRRDLFEIFETVLASSGFSLSMQGGVYVIDRQLGDTGGFHLARGPVTDSGGVYVVPLRYISAFEMIRILESVTSPSLNLQASATGNILFASGSRGDIEAMLDAVNLFDIDFMRGKSVSRVPLRAASPGEVVDELNAVFSTGEGGALEGVLRFVPNETLGSILIISTRAQYIAEAERWIRSYDDTAGANRQVTVVYKLENRAAIELAPVMDQLLSFGTLSLGDGAVAPASASVAVARGSEAGASATPAAATSGEAVTAPAVRQTAALPARIVADDTANALIVHATPREHEEISRLIKRLDGVAVQVLIEATIAEVTLNDNLDFGVRWFLENGDFNIGFSPLDVAGVNPILPGFNAILDSNSLKIAISALESATDINIVSSPTLLVLDNREAVLNVGDQVPVVTQQAVSVTDPNAPIVNSVEQRDTGVILTIRPRVSSGGRVILEIQQEVSDVVETTTSGIDSPTIQQRLVSTTVAVDNAQSIVLGGLIRETRVRRRNKVPILGDIPVLGALFRDVSDKDGRTELLVIITPRVISNTTEARRITDDYRSQLSRPSHLLNQGQPETKHRFRTIFY